VVARELETTLSENYLEAEEKVRKVLRVPKSAYPLK